MSIFVQLDDPAHPQMRSMVKLRILVEPRRIELLTS
jgi:hypothetical protein